MGLELGLELGLGLGLGLGVGLGQNKAGKSWRWGGGRPARAAPHEI